MDIAKLRSQAEKKVFNKWISDLEKVVEALQIEVSELRFKVELLEQSERDRLYQKLRMV